MFTEHTNGLIAYSLSTFILGLLTIRNLSFAIIFCLLLLSIHLVIGIWMFGLIILTYSFIFENKNIKKILFITLIIFLIALFYFNSHINYAEIPYEFSQKDYDDYFYYIEAHRNNMGDLRNMYFDYVLKSFILLILIFFYLKHSRSNIFNNYNFFFKTLSLSIIFSGIIYFIYKIFPEIFPEIAIRTIPQRFFLIHSVVGYPIMISIFYIFLKKFFIFKNFKKDYALQSIAVILILHLLQQQEALKLRFQNIEIIKENKLTEQLFWQNVNDLNNKTIIYSKSPILFCFESLDYIPYLPKLASPSQDMTQKILGISYSDVKYKNLGGISEIEIKKAYENKKIAQWKIIKELETINNIYLNRKLLNKKEGILKTPLKT